MEYPRVFTKSSKVTQKYIINIGSAMFVQLGLDKMSDEEVLMKFNSINQNGFDEVYQEKIDKLEDNVKELKKEKKLSDKDHQDELKEKRAQLDEDHKEEIQDMKEQLRLHKQEKDEEIKQRVKDGVYVCEQNLNDKIEMIKKHHEIVNEQKDGTIQHLENENKTKDNIINEVLGEQMLKGTEKGPHAENVIKRIMESCLPFDEPAAWLPTNRTAGSGDCIITFSQKYKHLRLMIEVKMKGVITQEDHRQFVQHYTDDFNNDKIDLAMMISYDHGNISGPGPGCCLVPKYSEINSKVIYFGLEKKTIPQHKKEIIIKGLHKICEEYNDNKNVVTSPVNNNYVDQVEERFKDFKNSEILINKVIKNSKNQIKEFEGNKQILEKNRNKLLKQLYDNEMISKIHPEYINQNEGQLKEIFFNKIKQKMKDKNVSLTPQNQKGKRLKWKEILKKDLEINLQPYEKKWWDKMKENNLD